MERQETPQDLSSREITQRKIKDVLDYLGENYNIIDKSVREGDATNMDIARSFTADTKSDKLVENIGLLDFTPLGTYFAFEEGQKEIMKEEPDAFKRQMALLGSINKPLQSIIDRPEIALPATEMAMSMFEALPVTYVLTKPIRKFFSSLKSKKKNNVTEGKTSLPTSQGFDEDTYYHVTTKDFEQFNPNISFKKGLYKDEDVSQMNKNKRGATFFTKDLDTVNNILAETKRKKGLRIKPVKIKTDDLFDVTNKKHLEKFKQITSDNNEYMLMTFLDSAFKGKTPLYEALENVHIQRNLKEAGFRGYKLDGNKNMITEKGSVGLFYPDQGDVRGKFAKP